MQQARMLNSYKKYLFGPEKALPEAAVHGHLKFVAGKLRLPAHRIYGHAHLYTYRERHIHRDAHHYTFDGPTALKEAMKELQRRQIAARPEEDRRRANSICRHAWSL